MDSRRDPSHTGLVNLAVTGASGLLGRQLLEVARGRGHRTVAFTRRPERGLPGADEVRRFELGREVDVSGIDAVVHLAGENLLGLWTKAKRERLRSSRIDTTRQLVEALAAVKAPSDGGQPALVAASAVGYYGDGGEAMLAEHSPAGRGFLAELCVDWEREANRHAETGGRVVNARLGVVLSADGGAFPLQRRAFSLCLGGRFGNGRQWFSWIHIEDAVGLLLAAAENAGGGWSGPVNVVAPGVVTNAGYTRALASALRRPAILPAPAPVLRLVLRDMAQMFLFSQRARPAAAEARGFAFARPQLADALADLLGG